MSKDDPKSIESNLFCQEDVQTAKASLNDLDVEDPTNGKEKLERLINEDSQGDD